MALEKTARQLKAEQTKQNLIDSAVKLFCAYGIDAVGVRDIAADANVTTGTFYHYFKSKIDIVVAVHRMIAPNFPTIMKEKSGEASMRAAIKDTFTDLLTNQTLQEGIEFTRWRITTEPFDLFSIMSAAMEYALRPFDLPLK